MSKEITCPSCNSTFEIDVTQTSGPKTKYTRKQIEDAVKAKGYVWFEDSGDKGYDVNIVGVRNSSTGDRVTNHYDDNITISYKVDGEWKFYC